MALADIFKSYDIRGKVGTELSAELSKEVGMVFADWLPTKGPVAVGRDMRPDSVELAAAFMDGLTAQGRKVWDIGEVTTDMIYFAVGKYGFAGGAMITASHNPGADNGIKLCREEARPVGIESGLAEIRDSVLNGLFKKPLAAPGSITPKDITEDWITHVLSFINTAKLKPLRLAVDAGNGMAGKIFPELEPYVPWEITEMYFELDGTFPNHEANPLKFETLADIIAVIKENSLDGGVAFDGDGDRAFLIDETGTVLSGGVMSAMLAGYFLDKNPGGAIVYDVRNSRSVPDVVTEKGGKPIITKVGHANIKTIMRKHDASFGGEASGHFYFRDNWYADSGLIGAVIGLYVATLSGQKLSQLREQYTRYAAIPETNFVIPDKDKAITSLEVAFSDAKITKMDGITVDLGNGKWFNVRPSNTESLLRLNAEAKTQSELNELVAKVTELIDA